MENRFIFQVYIPVSYISTDNITGCSTELDDILEELNISIDTEELEIPPVNLFAKYHGIAKTSDFKSIIKSYANREDVIYDLHGIAILTDYFGCPEYLVYSCLEFYCEFSVTNSFIDDYNERLDTETEKFMDESMWAIQRYDNENGKEKILYGASEIFSDILYANISTLLCLMNLARPNSISANCIFVDRYYFSNEDFHSNVPDVKVFKIHTIGNYTAPHISARAYDYWEKLLNVPLKKVWDWYNKVLAYSKNADSNILKALERYFLVFATDHATEVLLSCIAALEALYVLPFNNEKKDKREPSKQNQLHKNMSSFLNIKELLPNEDFEQLIRDIYNQRSRIIHGDKSIPNPFRKSFNEDLDIKEAASKVLFLLICSLRQLCELDLLELPVPYSQ